MKECETMMRASDDAMVVDGIGVVSSTLTVEALMRLQPLNPFVPLVMSVQETKKSE